MAEVVGIVTKVTSEFLEINQVSQQELFWDFLVAHFDVSSGND